MDFSHLVVLLLKNLSLKMVRLQFLIPSTVGGKAIAHGSFKGKFYRSICRWRNANHRRNFLIFFKPCLYEKYSFFYPRDVYYFVICLLKR